MRAGEFKLSDQEITEIETASSSIAKTKAAS